MSRFLFDLDGTLIDSDADLAAAANAARAQARLPALPTEQVTPWIGHGARHLLRGVLPGVEGAAFEDARQAFIEHYASHLLDQTRPCTGAEAALARCASAGLVTNKPARFTAEILAGLGWTERFDVVVAGDTLPQRKPDPTPLIHAAERVTPVAYVGDSEVDEQAADRAGLRFIAVDWGRSTHPVRVTDLRHIFEVQWSR